MKTSEFNPLDYAASIRHAILRSISHDETVRTPVPADGRIEMMEYLKGQNEIADLGDAVENDGSREVWGTFRGEKFRIRFIA